MRVILRNLFWASVAAALAGLSACSSVPAKVAPAALPSVAPVSRAVTSTKQATTDTLKATDDARVALDAAIVQAHQEQVEKDETKRAAEQELLARALIRARDLVQVANDKASNAETVASNAVAETAKFDAAQKDATVRAEKVQEQNDELRADQELMHKWHGWGAIIWGLKTFLEWCFLWLAGLGVAIGALSFFFPAFGVIVGGFFTRIAHVFFPPGKT